MALAIVSFERKIVFKLKKRLISRFLLVFVLESVFAVKLLDTSLRSGKPLTSSEERVAVAAGIHTQFIALYRTTGFKFCPAGRAYDFNLVVIGVNSLFHTLVLLPP